MTLSILIPSLIGRKVQLQELMSGLLPQLIELGGITTEDNFLGNETTLFTARNGNAEIISLTDNKQYSTGAKRQRLLLYATGTHVVFIDDDDTVPAYYLREFLKGLQQDPDCVAINGTMTTDGRDEMPWRISRNYENRTVAINGVPTYVRTTNHITAVRRTLALQAGFPDKSNAEDKHYSERVAPLCKSESIIIPPMYHYRYSSVNKEYK